MSSKTTVVLCTLVLFIQSALNQCNSPAAIVADAAPFAIPYGLSAPYGYPASYLNEPFGYGAPFINEPYGYAAPFVNEHLGYGAPFLAEPYGYGPALGSPCGFSGWESVPTSGGSLPITSASGIPPVGISVVSDNVFEGLLSVAGELPFVGTVSVDGTVPSIGYGAINHACGNGVSAIVSDMNAYAPGYGGGYGPLGAIGPGLSGPTLGYEAGWVDMGCGCRYIL